MSVIMYIYIISSDNILSLNYDSDDEAVVVMNFILTVTSSTHNHHYLRHLDWVNGYRGYDSRHNVFYVEPR